MLFFPWWLTALIVLAAVSVVGKFYEALAYGIVMDAVYGTALGFHGFSYAATLYAVAIFIVANAIRKRVVW